MTIWHSIILIAIGWAAICGAVWFAFLRNIPISDDDSTYGAEEGFSVHRQSKDIW